MEEQQTNLTNNSGGGKDIQVPDEIAKPFNWGAFLLSWIWGIGNNTYITLAILVAAVIPFVGPILSLGGAIWFGKMGNTWAWQNKHFDSVEAFLEYQKKWMMAGLIVLGVSIVLGILMGVLAVIGGVFAHRG